jgi:aspartate aminotransferase
VIVRGLNAIPGVKCANPGGAFYVFPDFRAWLGKRHGDLLLKDDATLCEALLTRALVAGVPGKEFGASGFVRFSYAASDAEIRKAVERIGKFAAELS